MRSWTEGGQIGLSGQGLHEPVVARVKTVRRPLSSLSLLSDARTRLVATPVDAPPNLVRQEERGVAKPSASLARLMDKRANESCLPSSFLCARRARAGWGAGSPCRGATLKRWRAGQSRSFTPVACMHTHTHTGRVIASIWLHGARGKRCRGDDGAGQRERRRKGRAPS